MRYFDFANKVQSNGSSETLMTLIDLSPSMDFKDWKPSRIAGAITANKELIKLKLQSHPDDKMGIIGFGGTARILHAPVCVSKGIQGLQRALIDPRAPYGTNFTAALNLAGRCFLGKINQPVSNFFSRMLSDIFVESDNHQKTPIQQDGSLKRIIMLTDGEHNQGGCPLAIASRLKSSGVIIDCIGIGGSPADVDEALLKQIASQNPDGSIRYCFIGDQQQLLRKYQTLARHIQVV
ncbi:MAG: VWA domain-containing protein [Anaerohalosphaera sp.]|nr:VWA domain-containing protein [Anaerohalosphaera sp.]